MADGDEVDTNGIEIVESDDEIPGKNGDEIPNKEERFLEEDHTKDEERPDEIPDEEIPDVEIPGDKELPDEVIPDDVVMPDEAIPTENEGAGADVKVDPENPEPKTKPPTAVKACSPESFHSCCVTAEVFEKLPFFVPRSATESL